jgi:GT2 family glycosyltransferase
MRFHEAGPAPTGRTIEVVPEPRVSAIVVTYNTGDALWECLDAALQDPWIDELLIVNNGNPPHVAQRLELFAAAHRAVTLITGHGNIGFGAACNLGARQARGHWVLMLNPDAVIEPGSAEAMAQATRGRVGPTVVGGLLQNAADGREQRGARRGELSLWSAFVSCFGLSRVINRGVLRDLHRESEPLPDRTIPMPVISGALVLIPRSDFRRLGGFDEAYFLHVEDIDLCQRVRRMGGEVLFTPFAKAKHYGSTSRASIVWIEWQKTKGLARYFWRFSHGVSGKIATVAVAPLFAIALLGRSLVMSARRILQKRMPEPIPSVAARPAPGAEPAPARPALSAAPANGQDLERSKRAV